ncbi:hypothetical protein Bca52824_019717 [Brassica carinata]|uniref:Replication factor A C-terminal domain-containing protein n=1 Tax=Brassica carinata TaxID=52824 RepID=A0A8X7VSM6_BRACI|nr:hypothetical protein Bca52824_019717 [Brassica carinata]
MWSTLHLRYRVEMTISDATYSAVFVVFDAEMSKTNVRAAEAGELMICVTTLLLSARI